MANTNKNNRGNERPSHMVTSSKKTEKEYYIPTIEYYRKQSNFSDAYNYELDVLYEAAEGIIRPNTYKYVLNPSNTSNDQFTRYPAQLRNYDILGPVLNLFLGETSRRPNNPNVIAKNADSKNKMMDAKNDAMTAILAQDFVNNLNSAGIDTGVDSKEIPNYKDAAEQFDESYVDKVAILGQEALDYLMYYLEFDDKILQLMYDWLVCGYVITYKDVYKDDVGYEICDPRDVSIIGMPDNGFAEDAEAIIYRKYMTRSELIDEYNDELLERKTEDGKSYMSEINTRKFGGNVTIGPIIYGSSMNNNDRENWSSIDEGKALVEIVCWQGMKKIGNLIYEDPITGQIAQREVDDTYKLEKEEGDIEIIWEWVNYWSMGHVVDDNLYVRIEDGLVQRNEINNTAKNKLPFNARIRGYRTRTINSIVKLGLPFSILYNIVHFRLEFTLAKHKNSMTAFPVGLIPNKDGWDEDKWFYWGTVHDFLFYDETAPNAAAAIQGIKNVGGTLSNYIVEMWNILTAIKNEWWDTVGVNRQRLGDTLASDGKAVSEQAVFRSSLITEDLFIQFDKFLEREYEGLLDYSKVAWVDGKKASYVTSDGFKAFLEIEGSEYQTIDLGIFVSNSREEFENLQAGKNILQAMTQNGMDAPTVLEVLSTRNISKVKRLAKKALKAERDLAAQREQADRDNALNIQQMKSKDIAMASADKRYVADKKYEADIKTALIAADANINELVNDTMKKSSELTDSIGEDKMNALEERRNFMKEAFEQERLNLANKNAESGLIKSATALKIARENRNRYDK